MSRQAQWNNVRLTEKEREREWERKRRNRGSKSDTAMVEARLRQQRYRRGTVGGTGRWLWVCVSALSILEQESFCSPFCLSFSLFENHTIARFPSCLLPSRRRPVRRPPFILSHTSFVVLSSTRSPLDQANPPRRPPATSSPLVPLLPLVLVSRPLSTYLYLFASLHCAIRRVDPRPRTQSPSVPGFYYEIRDSPPASSRFTHTHSPPVYALRTRRRRDIYWQTLRMSDHAGLRISSNIVFSYTLVPCGSNPRAEIRFYYLPRFYHDENLVGIHYLLIRFFFNVMIRLSFKISN